MGRRPMGWLSVVATVLSAGAVAVSPPAVASGDDVVVIGELAGKVSLRYLRQPAPTAGTPTASVNAGERTATFAVKDANGAATITVAWPARVGIWQLSGDGVGQHV